MIAGHIMAEPALADRDLRQRETATFATRDNDGSIRLLFRHPLRFEAHSPAEMAEVVLDVAAAGDTTDVLTTLLDR